MSGVRIGEITHFFDGISVSVIALTDTLRIGDIVHILGRSTDFQQEVKSLQIEHQPVEQAGPGQEVAMKVERRVRPKDKVYRISPEG